MALEQEVVTIPIKIVVVFFARWATITHSRRASTSTIMYNLWRSRPVVLSQ
eukprot:COSAG02_NODE_611_length_19555_cov_34.449270_10_plen_51_part_00